MVASRIIDTGTEGAAAGEATGHGISFGEAARVWARIGLLSFGGPAAQIAHMHRLLVEERRWVSEERFLHALSYCMLLPGPEAQQLAIYVGWLLHKTRGGLLAGVFFVIPGVVAMLALSVLYVGYRDATAITAIFFGVKPAIIAVVLEAVQRIGKRALRTRLHTGIAVVAFAGIFFLDVPFPLIVAGAGLVGLAGARFVAPQAIAPGTREKAALDALLDDGALAHTRPSLGRSLRILGVCLVLWFAPIAAFALTVGPGSVYVQEGLFFSKTAVVTFGGAYAVLAYIAQRAVETYGWMRPGEMLDGLALAESTPGPLIMVVQFVGFLAAYRDPGGLTPMVAATLGALLTTWVTFVPCFLWIFLGAPYIEALRGSRRVQAALGGITAAVVGVIANLSLWFALHTIFATVDERHVGPLRLLVPAWSTVSVPTAVLAIGASVAMLRFKVGMGKTLAASAAAGVAYHLVTS